jgi:aryl-alcohol dehydrogenase-like predicted oxidoreductase
VYDEDKLYGIIEELVAVGADLGVSAARVALAYIMAKPAVTSLIVGARTEEQLADNLAAADLELPAAAVERLDEVSAHPLPYPLWHQARNARERFGPADSTLLPRLLNS